MALANAEREAVEAEVEPVAAAAGAVVPPPPPVEAEPPEGKDIVCADVGWSECAERESDQRADDQLEPLGAHNLTKSGNENLGDETEESGPQVQA